MIYTQRLSPPPLRAFTMLELVTVVVIMFVVATMAVPRFSSFIVTQKLDAAARRIMVDLELAQRDARFTGTSRTITFNAVGDRYRLWGFQDIDDPNADYIIILRDEPYGVDLVSASFGGDMTLIYDAYGMPDSGGTIVIQVGDLQRTINVDGGSGRATGLPIADTSAQ